MTDMSYYTYEGLISLGRTNMNMCKLVKGMQLRKGKFSYTKILQMNVEFVTSV